MEMSFRVYGRLITNKEALEYLICILTAMGENWLVVVDNLSKDRNNWDNMYSILRRKGKNDWTPGKF